MKIVSLQSVGLGAIFSGVNEPYKIKVGKDLYNGRGYSLNVTVTDIGMMSMSGRNEPHDMPSIYEVYTSDGHVRVLPAEKYIAEWSE